MYTGGVWSRRHEGIINYIHYTYFHSPHDFQTETKVDVQIWTTKVKIAIMDLGTTSTFGNIDDAAEPKMMSAISNKQVAMADAWIQKTP